MNYFQAHDYTDLAAHILNMDIEDYDLGAVEEALAEKWNLELDDFIEIACLLIRCTIPQLPMLRQTPHYIFARPDGVNNDGNQVYAAIVKEEMKAEDFQGVREEAT